MDKLATKEERKIQQNRRTWRSMARHPSVQNNDTILLHYVRWSQLVLLPCSSCLEPAPCSARRATTVSHFFSDLS